MKESLVLPGEKAAEDVEAGREAYAVENASRHHAASPLRRQLCISISFGEKGCGGMEVERDVVVVAVEVVVVPRRRAVASCRRAAASCHLPLPPPRGSRYGR
jgi:hypothetical protein